MRYKTDKEYINEQYKDDKNLNARIKIHKYSTNKEGWFNWLIKKCQIRDNMKILELGCGNGRFWNSVKDILPKNIDLTLSDISPGMIETAKKNLKPIIKNISFKVFNAEKIPFEDNIFDIVVANHMLYHVENIDSVLFESRRILKKSGKLAASTNGKEAFKELAELIKRYNLPYDFEPVKFSENFGLENGEAILGKYFKKINRHLYEDNLSVKRADVIMDYINSVSKTKNSLDREDIKNSEKLKKYIQKSIEKKGYFFITKSTGFFEAFVEE